MPTVAVIVYNDVDGVIPLYIRQKATSLDSFWLTIIALAVTGIDPIGALIGITALAGGAKRDTVVVYGLAKFVGSISVGTILALTAANISINIDWSFPMISDAVWALGELVIGAILIAIGIRLWRTRGSTDDGSPKWRWMFRSPVTLVTAGFLTGITAPTDPTFVAVTYLAGKTENIFTIIAAHTTWIVISQLPLTLLMIALIFNKHRTVSLWIQIAWQRIQPLVRHAIMGVVTVIGTFFILNVGLWAVAGQWLPLR